MSTQISVGRIVHYRLSEKDAEEINRRRLSVTELAAKRSQNITGRGGWPEGAQAHVGVDVAAGDVLPMLVVRVHGQTEPPTIAGQVVLPGNDTLWLMGVSESKQGENGCWNWPPRV